VDLPPINFVWSQDFVLAQRFREAVRFRVPIAHSEQCRLFDLPGTRCSTTEKCDRAITISLSFPSESINYSTRVITSW
jgi:hypothetical protein